MGREHSQTQRVSKIMETKKKLENGETGQSGYLSKPSLVEAKGAVLKAGFVIGSAALIVICLRNSLTWHVARYTDLTVITSNENQGANNCKHKLCFHY